MINLYSKSASRRVVCGMSGGTDSSAATLLLHRSGYEVVGIILKLWQYPEDAGSGRCCTPEDVRDARKIAAQLEIPFYVRDYSKTFANEVVNTFTADYLRGRTPNPCVVCNDKIKFHFLDLLANDVDADYVATGHYARIKQDKTTGEYQLWRGVDETRDQSYFLFRLTQEKLARLIFPLGEMCKQEVRQLLRQANCSAADKPESREICFVDGKDYASFVEARATTAIARGSIVDEQQRVLATHQGIHRFTVGQRKGIGVASPQPLFVTKIDAATQQVHVGSRETALKSGCRLEQLSWIGKPLKDNSDVQLQLRYRGRPIEAKITTLDKCEMQLHFRKTKEIPAPGQAAVLYDGERVLGGGWIV